MKNISIILLFFFCFYPDICTCNDSNLNGEWIQVERDRSGCGKIIKISKNCTLRMFYGSILVSRYLLKKNTIIETKPAPEQSTVLGIYEYNFSKNKLIIKRIISYNPKKLSDKLILIRPNHNDADINQTIVGQWISAPKEGRNYIIEFTTDGKKLFFIPFFSNYGTYTVKDDFLYINLKKPEKTLLKYQVTSKKFTLVWPKNIQENYIKFY